jgi:hypothetical protein
MALAAMEPKQISIRGFEAYWHGDDAAERILKAARNLADATNFWAATSSVILPALAPASAPSKLMRPMRALASLTIQPSLSVSTAQLVVES